MRKSHTCAALLLMLCFLLTGCGDTDSGHNATTENSVQAVLDEQTKTTESSTTEEETTEQTTTETTTETTAATYVPYALDMETEVIEPNSDSPDIDYDLTLMDKNMVYATVYQFMVDPASYEGKVVRIEGQYYGLYYDADNCYYHYCIIQDAIGCCSQGMEFVWGDGSHVYPDEYPEEDAVITVTGTFETYHEDNQSFVYIRLADATLTVN